MAKKFNIRVEEIDEILGKAPSRVVRRGISIIFIIIIILLVGTWVFKYPDFISSTIVITSFNPPADVLVKSAGRIDSLCITDNEIVSKGQVLAIIENPANYPDVQRLSHSIDSINYIIKESGFNDSLQHFFPHIMKLGDLESSFSAYIASYNDIVNYMSVKYYQKSINSVLQQINQYRKYQDKIKVQKQTEETDLMLSEKDYERYKILYKSGTISESDLDQSQSRFLSKKFAVENMLTSIANTNIQISQLENSIIDLKQQDRQQKDKLLLNLKSSYYNLKGKIDIWTKQYIIKAPETGKCVFTEYWSKNQNVKIGEKIFTIIPQKTNRVLGKLLLPFEGAGKVKIGQNVNVRLSNYPYMEFGMLIGKVKKISLVPNENNYYVEVVFPEGMKTTYGKQLTFSQRMQGTAKIITNDRRLFYRIIEPLRSVLTEKIEH